MDEGTLLFQKFTKAVRPLLMALRIALYQVVLVRLRTSIPARIATRMKIGTAWVDALPPAVVTGAELTAPLTEPNDDDIAEAVPEDPIGLARIVEDDAVIGAGVGDVAALPAEIPPKESALMIATEVAARQRFFFCMEFSLSKWLICQRLFCVTECCRCLSS